MFNLFKKAAPDYSKPRMGDTILRIELDGCMAEQRTFIWAGPITQFFHAGSGIPCALVKIAYGRDRRSDGSTVTTILSRLRPVAPGIWVESV